MQGLPDDSGWQLPYPELIRRFLAEAPITSSVRRERLRQVLELNLAKLQHGVDFTHKGRLTSACQALRLERGDEYVRAYIQQPLKQVSAWASSVNLFPYDPLARWKRLPRSVEAKRKSAWMPDEMRAFFAAADELDGLLARPFPTGIIFKTLLITGNRPGGVSCHGRRFGEKPYQVTAWCWQET
jgi:hypothetical protein